MGVPSSRRQFIGDLAALSAGGYLTSRLGGGVQGALRAGARRPNILVGVADDWSWPHAGMAGAPVETPTFDRLVREGVLFENAFAAAPSCTPSRAAMLTGQWHWRLEQGANLWGTLPAQFDVYPDILEQHGYHSGYCGKGWGPGLVRPGGRTRNPAGPKYRSFEHFLRKRPSGTPFCFWFGSHDPHRFYGPGSRILNRIDPEDVDVPPFLPDTIAVRRDLARYLWEVQRFDRDFGEMLALLEHIGELDNTIVVMTSDNGMPFPRCKSNLYDFGVRVPLVVRWGSNSRVVASLTSLCDLAPSFLEAAGIAVPPAMTGKSLLPSLFGDNEGRGEREWILTGKERHICAQAHSMGGYPMRAVRTREHLYIRNCRPERWPAGAPPHYRDVDSSPTKRSLIEYREGPVAPRLFDLSFAKRPSEELYDLRRDPFQMTNLAENPMYLRVKWRLAALLQRELAATDDPRVAGGGDVFDTYAYYMLRGVSQ
jgi:N-sulfoglucosamine sulfohydrolase